MSLFSASSSATKTRMGPAPPSLSCFPPINSNSNTPFPPAKASTDVPPQANPTHHLGHSNITPFPQEHLQQSVVANTYNDWRGGDFPPSPLSGTMDENQTHIATPSAVNTFAKRDYPQATDGLSSTPGWIEGHRLALPPPALKPAFTGCMPDMKADATGTAGVNSVGEMASCSSGRSSNQVFFSSMNSPVTSMGSSSVTAKIPLPLTSAQVPSVTDSRAAQHVNGAFKECVPPQPLSTTALAYSSALPASQMLHSFLAQRNVSERGKRSMATLMQSVESLCQRTIMTEQRLSEAIEYFSQMAAVEQELMEALQLVRGRGQGRESGAEEQRLLPAPLLRPSSSNTVAPTRSCSGFGKVQEDLIACSHLVAQLDYFERQLQKLESVYRDMQKRFLVDQRRTSFLSATSSDCYEGFVNRWELAGDESLSVDHANGVEVGEAYKLASFLSTEVLGSIRGVMAYLTSDIASREEAIKTRLMDELLLYRREVPASMNESSANAEKSPTHLTRTTGGPAPEGAASESATPLMLLVSIPNSAGGSGNEHTFMTVIATPARYALMQLYEAATQRIADMSHRLTRLEKPREDELHQVNTQLEALDPYDPLVDSLSPRKQQCETELSNLKATQKTLSDLRRRTEDARSLSHKALRDCVCIRRQLMEVLEQRWQEYGSAVVTPRGSRIVGNEKPTTITEATGCSTSESAAARLPRASTVFLDMLASITREQAESMNTCERQATEFTSGTPLSSVVAVASVPSEGHIRIDSKAADDIATASAEHSPSHAISTPSHSQRETLPFTAFPTDDVKGVSAGYQQDEQVVPLCDADEGHTCINTPYESGVCSVNSELDSHAHHVEDEVDDGPRTYNLRHGIIGGMSAFFRAVARRATSFSDDEEMLDDVHDDGYTPYPLHKRQRTE